MEKYDNNGIVQSKLLLYPKAGFSKKELVDVKARSFGFGYKSEEPKDLKINSVGNILHFLGFGFTDGYGENDRKIEGTPEIKGYASGCSFIIKKEVLDVIGGYNEEYYMYHDDIEMSLKTRLAGYRIVLAPRSVMYHKYEFSRSVRMIYQMERNRYLLMFHFYKIPTILVLLPAILIMDVGMLFYSLINGWIGVKLNVYKYFLKVDSWKKIIKTRKEIKKLRKINDSQIVKNVVGKVEFQEINNPVLKYIANPILNAYWVLVRKLIKW